MIVLHTVAPREFDERTLKVLAYTAPLVAGAIENARLYEDARRRIEALTRLSWLSQGIAGADGPAGLYTASTEGVRSLLDCDEVRLYEIVTERERLELVAAEPPTKTAVPQAAVTTVLLNLLRNRGRPDVPGAARLQQTLKLPPTATHIPVEPLVAGDEHVGVLVACGSTPLASEGEEMMRAVTNQLAVALKKTELIERLTEENVAHELFEALLHGRIDDARELAARSSVELERPHVYVNVTPSPDRGGIDAGPGRDRNRRRRPSAQCTASPQLGVYRCLVRVASEPTRDPYVDAVRKVADYDAKRGGQLVQTLEQYLADRRSVTETARALTVHPNALRQRLDRITTLTGLDLATADLLVSELALKLARLQPGRASTGYRFPFWPGIRLAPLRLNGHGWFRTTDPGPRPRVRWSRASEVPVATVRSVLRDGWS